MALLAQQEVVASKVQRRLLDLDPNALARARREAEALCVRRFGLFIPTGDGEDEDEEGLAEDEHSEEEGFGVVRLGEGGLVGDFEAVAEEEEGSEVSEGPGSGHLFGRNDDYGEYEDELKDL